MTMTLRLFHKADDRLPDDALMQKVCLADDDRAFAELYRRHARRLMGFFFRQTDADEDLASDLLQDAFMHVWTARRKFVGTGFRTWLFTISYNLLRSHYRQAEYRRLYEQQTAPTLPTHTEADIDENLDRKAFDTALRQHLQALPPEARLLFSLRFEEELTVPQIAEVTGLPEGTVKSRLHTLTQTLRQKLIPS